MRALGLLLLAGCAAAPGPGRRPPNIVLIVTDDQGYAELACQGGDLPTPNLDRLAASGVRFSAGYVTAPFCSPSRAGLLTGRYQQRFGHERNPVEKVNDRPEVGLPLSEATLADRLRAAGYVTGMTGKWHLGVHPGQHPRRRGFDEFFGFLREGRYYLPDGAPVVSHLRPREPDYNRLNPILRGEQEVEEPAYLTDAFGREACDFVERHAARPFFLYLPFNAPHSPMQAKPEDVGDIADPQRRVWAGMMKAMDRAVGRLLDTLRRLGLERDTLVVFLSDNGGPTKELTSRNDPFSGGKGSLLEGGLRVPFLMSWPGTLPAGVVEPRPVSALDVVPTSLAAAGAPIPAGLDGVDLRPFLDGRRRDDPHAALYWRMGGAAAVRRGRWKLVRLKEGDPFRLFDLGEDVGETRDRAAAEPAQVRELSAVLADWERGLVPPLW